MAYKFSFEKLEAWQLYKDFIKEIYKITKDFPDSEKYGLVSQINRASLSIASNLAEGSSRTSSKDQAHFSQLAYSSLMEVICQLIISKELEYISEEELETISKELDSIMKMNHNLQKTL